jgi:hypothetical protein
MKNRWSMATLVMLAGVLAVTVALSPSAALAKEFKYAGPPAFAVTYPDAWEETTDNPEKMVFRSKQAGTLPIMDIRYDDAPAGVTLADLGKKWYKKRVEAKQQTVCNLMSNKEIKLKDGTPAIQTVLAWKYQGFMDLQSCFIGTIKGGKLVYVAVHQYPGDCTWGPGLSLTFK